MKSASHRHGFTLIEVLVAGLILAVGAVVICGLSRRCLRNCQRGYRYEQAYRLLDECLDRTAALGVSRLAVQKTVQGRFPQRYPGYQFVVKIEPTEDDDLFEVTATVNWEDSASGYEVSAATLLYDLQDQTTGREGAIVSFTGE